MPVPARRPILRGRPLASATLALLLIPLLAVSSALSPAPAGAGSDTAPAGAPGRGSMDADDVALGPGAGRATRALGDGDGPAAAPTGWTATVDLLPGTQMVALSWDGDASGPDGPGRGQVSLRTRTGDGPWSAWLARTPDPDDAGGEGAGRVGTDVIWLGADGADRIELRVDAGPLTDLRLLRMRYHEGEPVVAEAPAGPRTRSTAGPTIRPRSAWATSGWRSGNSGCGSGPQVASRLDHVVLHHTATTNSYTEAQVPGLIDAIYRYHTDQLGWCDIAYNFVVDKFGGIWQGRSGDITKPVIGGHAQGFNTNSAGVTLLGQFEPGASPTAAQPTAALLDAAARLIAWKLDLHGLDPLGSVTVTSGGSTRYASGQQVTIPVVNAHQATSTTACPGSNVLSRMGELRQAVAAYAAGSPPPPSGPPDPRYLPFTNADHLVVRQYLDFLRRTPAPAERTWWADALDAGTRTPVALITSLMGSAEYEARTASTARLYYAYFGRPPDHPGLVYWWERIDLGTGVRQVSAAFAHSAEFTSRYGSLSDDAFVRLVYRNVLGREAEPEGFAYWSERLRTRRETRGGLMTLFSESAEYRALTRSRVDLAVTYSALLRRAASPEMQVYWEGRLATEPFAALLTHLLGTEEYTNKVLV